MLLPKNLPMAIVHTWPKIHMFLYNSEQKTGTMSSQDVFECNTIWKDVGY